MNYSVKVKPVDFRFCRKTWFQGECNMFRTGCYILTFTLLFGFGLFALSACGNSDESEGDGDVESSENSDAGETDGDAGENSESDESEAVDGDADLEEEAEAVTREAVDGVSGWCKTSGTAARTCETADDCRAYRQAIEADCNGSVAEPLFDCALADRNEFPSEFDAQCLADSKCDYAPVDCIDGLCEFNLPDDSCESDSDCTFVDAGCFCFPMNKNSGTYDPAYGSECEQVKACPEDAHARCVYGSCRVVGAYLDEYIEAFCAKFEDWGINMFGGDEATCVEALSRDDYLAAASLRSSIYASFEATSLDGFISGPWSNYYLCMIAEQ